MTLKPHMSPYVLTIINPKSRNADNVGFIYQKYLISDNSIILSLITEFYQEGASSLMILRGIV